VNGWLIVVLAGGTLLFKTLGPLLAGGREPPDALRRVVELLTPALLTSLVLTSTLTEGSELVLDPRAAGLVLGAGVALTRAPAALALLVAAVVTSSLRALGWS
jgi:hypothetical protein